MAKQCITTGINPERLHQFCYFSRSVFSIEVKVFLRKRFAWGRTRPHSGIVHVIDLSRVFEASSLSARLDLIVTWKDSSCLVRPLIWAICDHLSKLAFTTFLLNAPQVQKDSVEPSSMGSTYQWGTNTILSTYYKEFLRSTRERYC